jgi:hypothetical protein
MRRNLNQPTEPDSPHPEPDKVVLKTLIVEFFLAFIYIWVSKWCPEEAIVNTI